MDDAVDPYTGEVAAFLQDGADATGEMEKDHLVIGHTGFGWIKDREEWDANTKTWSELNNKLSAIVSSLVTEKPPVMSPQWIELSVNYQKAISLLEKMNDEAMRILVGQFRMSVRDTANAIDVNPSTVSRKTKGMKRD